MSNSESVKKGGKKENKQEKVSEAMTSKIITLHTILRKITSILSVNQTKESKINR